MAEKWKSYTLPQFCQGHWMHCCQHWYTGFGRGKGMFICSLLECCSLICFKKFGDDVHGTICPPIPQCIVPCLLTWVVPCNVYYFVPVSIFFISPITTCSLHFLAFCWLLQCFFPIFFSRCCRHLDTFLHGLNITLSSCFLSKLLEMPWLTQTYIVLHAASLSSWIDITNHKGKHWIKLCILGYSANRLSSDVWFIE